MEGDPEVGAAVRHLLEAERRDVAPVLERGADGPLGALLAQVRGVVEDAVGQASLAPHSCKQKPHVLLLHVC